MASYSSREVENWDGDRNWHPATAMERILHSRECSLISRTHSLLVEGLSQILERLYSIL